MDRLRFEGNNSNNFAFVNVCVGGVPQCASSDAFETDNTCATAKWLQEATPQARDLCNPADPSAADTDWVKFTGFAGVQYTVSAAKPPLSAADALVTLYPSCSGGALAGPTATQATITAKQQRRVLCEDRAAAWGHHHKQPLHPRSGLEHRHHRRIRA